jgi:hypothetical protein
MKRGILILAALLFLAAPTLVFSQGENGLPIPDAPGTTSSPSDEMLIEAPDVEIDVPLRRRAAERGPWTMPQPNILQKNRIMMGGWLHQGITVNADSPASGFNGPVATNDMDGEYQMNQFWIWLHRQADTSDGGFDIGGHVDMMYGTDWRFGINNGLETKINGFNRQTYGMVIPQAYVELAYNKLSVKLGHFAAQPFDFEAIPAPMNPFYSHSYGYGYGIPQLVTGASADYRLTDRLTVTAGVHQGWFQFKDNNDSLDVLAGFKWTSEDQGTSLSYGISSGKQAGPGLPLPDENRFISSLVLQHQLTENLKYVLVNNLGIEEYVAGFPIDKAEWYGLNNYFLYTINPKWGANVRFEWFRDDDGVRVAGPGNIPGVRAFTGRQYAGHFYEVTTGLNWRPAPNWVVRPEARWDWYDGLAGPVGLPFNDGLKASQFTAAVDVVFTF